MAGVDELKALVDLLQSVLLPFQDAQAKQSQALVLVTQQLQRLVDMYQSEPTRQTVIDALRSIINDQSSDIHSVLDRIKTIIEEGHKIRDDSCNSRHVLQRERDDIRIKDSTANFEKQINSLKDYVTQEMDSVKEIIKLWNKIKMEVRIVYGIALIISGIALWLWHTTPIVKAAVHAAGTASGATP